MEASGEDRCLLTSFAHPPFLQQATHAEAKVNEMNKHLVTWWKALSAEVQAGRALLDILQAKRSKYSKYSQQLSLAVRQ